MSATDRPDLAVEQVHVEPCGCKSDAMTGLPIEPCGKHAPKQEWLVCPRCGCPEFSVSTGTYDTGVTGPDGHGRETRTEDVARCGRCSWVGDPEDLDRPQENPLI